MEGSGSVKERTKRQEERGFVEGKGSKGKYGDFFTTIQENEEFDEETIWHSVFIV